MKRIIAALFALAVTLMPSVADACGPCFAYSLDTTWSAGTSVPRGWKDSSANCSGSHFSVTLFRDENYQGMHTLVCSNETTFCEVPMEPYSSINKNICLDEFTDWFNDHASSFKINRIDSGYCLKFYQDAGFGGPSFTATGSRPDLGTTGWNDRISGLKLVGGGTFSC